MTLSLELLVGTAFMLAITHTLLGPDHYIPFIALSKSRKWSQKKTMLVTFLCGIGHVLSSIVLGLLGLAFGIALFSLKTIEAYRGDIAAWFLLIFGFTYMVWGLHKAIRNRPHEHLHVHGGKEHAHTHTHHRSHLHLHEAKKGSMTPWVLFIIFVFGPCEPLIPLLIYPAAEANYLAAVLISVIFGVTTIATMMVVVYVSHLGLSRLTSPKLERFGHPIAGAVILLCGIAIVFFGL